MVVPLVKQIWAASGVLINMLGLGLVLSYPSCLLPALKMHDSPIKADLETASWLSSSSGLSCILGFLLSAILMEWRGRRFTHGVLILPSVVGWLFIYFANNISALMAGRILGGITVGGTISLGAVVIGEYTSPKHRGMFLNLKTTAVSLANLILHTLSHYLHWRTVALLCLIPQVISILIICSWPESPAWLASKRQYERSEKEFFWLRGKSKESVREFDEMIKAQKERLSKIAETTTILENIIEILKKFTRKDFIKPTIITFFTCVVLETSGRHVFPAYTIEFIADISDNKTHIFYYILGIDLCVTLSSSFSSYLTKIMRRRSLLFISGIASLVLMSSISCYLLLASKGVISKDRPLIPFSLFVIYFLLANLGCTPIPLALMGELFPLAHRGAGIAVSGFSLSICLMLILKVTPYLLNGIEVYGTFAVFGIAMGVSLMVLYYILPETKDRTLQQIEDYFNHGRFIKRPIRRDEEEIKIRMIKS